MYTEREPGLNTETLSREALIEEARGYRDQMRSVPYWQGSSQNDFYFERAYIDIASFGNNEEIDLARNNFVDVSFRTNFDETPKQKLTEFMELNCELAGEIGGEYYDYALDIVAGIPAKGGSVFRNRLLIELARMGDDAVANEAVNEIFSSQVPLQIKVDQFRRLQRYGRDMSKLVMQLTAQYDDPLDAVDDLLSMHLYDGTLPPVYTQAARGYIDEVNWSDLKTEPIYNNEQMHYLGQVAVLARTTRLSKYSQAFGYYIGEMDESTVEAARQKIMTIASAADIYKPAPSEISGIGVVQSLGLNFVNPFIVQSYARQGNIAGALEYTDQKISDGAKRFSLYRLIAQRSGGMEPIERALMDLRYVGGEVDRDRAVGSLFNVAIKKSSFQGAHKMLKYTAAPANKIKMIRQLLAAQEITY